MLFGIAAVHLAQHPVGTALHRKMDVVANLFALCNQVDQFPGAILWMGGHKADAEIPLQRLDLRKQLGKIDWLRQPFAVGIDILTQQQDLLVTKSDDFLCFLQDFLRFTADLSAAHIGDDTVRTEIVASVHNLQRSLHAICAAHRQSLRNRVFSAFSFKVVDHPALPFEQSVDQLRQGVQHMGSKNQLNKRIADPNLVDHLLLLHHAAAQTHDDRRICRLQAFELSYHA